jgi:MORN repeat
VENLAWTSKDACHGTFLYKLKEKSIEVLEFYYHRFYGYGELSWTSKDVYHGTFLYGLMEGNGTLYYRDGTRYQKEKKLCNKLYEQIS